MISILTNPYDSDILGQATLNVAGSIICVTFNEAYSDDTDKHMFMLKCNGRFLAAVRIQEKSDFESIELFRKQQDEAPEQGAGSSHLAVVGGRA
ncbi:hypothetical protein [Vibrio diazotrophicus]|uniref:hypothetical protein n=1 Tax=Vibrio diazotrophicus TaxID=685 RepID=UPI003D2F72A5